MKKKDSKTTTRKAGKGRRETGQRFPAQKQKQKQQQSVIVKIDQSKRVVQRERQPKQPIIQQPPPMNIMITPPPQLSINDAIRQQQPRMTSQQEQQIRQPLTQPMTQQTLQPNMTMDFIEDTPILARERLVGSDVPVTRLTAKSLAQHNFKESRKEGDELQDRGITRNTLLSSPNRFAALRQDDDSEPERLDLPPADNEDAQTEHGETAMNPKATVKFLLNKLKDGEITITSKTDISLLKKFNSQGKLSKDNKDYKRIVKTYMR